MLISPVAMVTRRLCGQRLLVIHENKMVGEMKIMKSLYFAGLKEAMQKMIQRGAEVNHINRNSYTAITYAAKHGATNTIKRVKVKENLLNFIAIIVTGHTDVVELLFQKRANINQVGNDRNTPLIWAAVQGNFLFCIYVL